MDWNIKLGSRFCVAVFGRSLQLSGGVRLCGRAALQVPARPAQPGPPVQLGCSDRLNSTTADISCGPTGRKWQTLKKSGDPRKQTSDPTSCHQQDKASDLREILCQTLKSVWVTRQRCYKSVLSPVLLKSDIFVRYKVKKKQQQGEISSCE